MVDTLSKQIDEVRELLASRLRIKGRDIDAQVRKAGRLLPRAVRRDAVYLAQAAGLVKNPKLMRMIDQSRADKAHRNVVTYLQTIDPRDIARGKLLSLLAAIALGLLVVAGLVLFVLVQRDLI